MVTKEQTKSSWNVKMSQTDPYQKTIDYYKQLSTPKPTEEEQSAQRFSWLETEYGKLKTDNPDRDSYVLEQGMEAIRRDPIAPYNAPTIDELEQTGKEWIEANEPGYGEVVGKGLVRGTMGLAGGVGSIVRWAGDVTGIDPLAKVGKEASEYWRKASQEGVFAGDKGLYRGTFMETPSFKRAVGIISEALPSLGAALMTGGAGMAAGLSRTAASWLAGTALATLEGSGQYEEAREAGKSISEASVSGLASTAGTAILESLAIGRFLRIGTKAGKAAGRLPSVKAAGKGMGIEGMQEGSQQIWQNLIAKMGYEPTRDLAEGIVEALIGGAGAGGIAGGVMSKLEIVSKKAKDVGVTDEEVSDAVNDLKGEIEEKARVDIIAQVSQDLSTGKLTTDQVDAIKDQYPELKLDLNEILSANVRNQVEQVIEFMDIVQQPIGATEPPTIAKPVKPTPTKPEPEKVALGVVEPTVEGEIEVKKGKAVDVLDKPISSDKNNVRAWFVEPENWDNKQRLTHREVAEQIAEDKDIEFKEEKVPIDTNKPLGETKSAYTAYLDGKKLRSFPKEVYDLVQQLKPQQPTPDVEPTDKKSLPVEAKQPSEMTIDEAIEAKKQNIVRQGVDESEIDSNQLKMWKQSHIASITNSPRDTNISARVLASLPETARESILRTHLIAASNWVDSFKIWNKPYRKVLEDVQIRAGIGEVKKMHREAVKQALESGALAPEQYKDLHEKDYGKLEEFAPGVKGSDVVEKPAEVEKGVGEAKYQYTWDKKLKLGRKVAIVTDAQWVTKKGKLSKLGEKIAESKWEDLSPAAQNIIKKKIDGLYDKPIIGEVAKMQPPTKEGEKVEPTTAEAQKILAQEKQIVKQREKANKAKSFRMWLKYAGGIQRKDKTWAGEIRDIVGRAGMKGMPPGIFKNSALGIDEMTLAAVEAGWLPKGATEDDFIRALELNPRERVTDESLDKLIQDEIDFYKAQELEKGVSKNDVSEAERAGIQKANEEAEKRTSGRDPVDQKGFNWETGEETKAFELTPEEPTAHEKVALLEKEGVVERPEKKPTKTIFPAGEGIKTVPGKQKKLFGPEKGETLDMFDQPPTKAPKAKPTPAQEKITQQGMEAAIDKFFSGDVKLTPAKRKELEKQKKLIERNIASGAFTEEQLTVPRERLIEIDQAIRQTGVAGRMVVVDKSGEAEPRKATDLLKDQEGFISLEALQSVPEIYDGVLTTAKDVINQGHTTLEQFTARMKEVFAEVWDKIKAVMKDLYATAKKILTSETGAITIEGKPTQSPEEFAKAYIKSFLDAQPKSKRPDVEKKVRREEKTFDKEHLKDATNTWDVVRQFMAVRKQGLKTTKTDVKSWERLLSVPAHFFHKIEALGRVFMDGLKNVDNRHIILDGITMANDGHYFTVEIDNFRKQDKAGYRKYKKYLKYRDQNGIGYSIAKNQDIEGVNAWDLFAVKAKDGDLPIATFTEEAGISAEQQAVEAMIQAEAKDYRKTGVSDQAVNALIAGRRITNNGFDILFQAMRDLEAHYKEIEQELPTETVNVDGKAVTVNLKLALAKMGSIRGYYMPRIRKPGRFVVFAEKRGAHPRREHFELKILADGWAARKRTEGYTTTVEPQKRMIEDVFEMAGQVVAQEAIINEALKRIRTRKFELKDFGLTVVDRKLGPGKRDFMVTGPAPKTLTPIFKKMGGKWYPSEGEGKTGPKVWHFQNPGSYFENRLAKVIAFEQAAVDVDTQTRAVFAKALVEQVSNIIKGRGVRAHMIQRVDAKGLEVWEGYEEDPGIALAKYARSVSAGEAKKIMARDMLAHFTGTDISWKEFQGLEGEDVTYEDYLDFVEERRVDPVNQENGFKEGKSYIEHMLRNDEAIDRLTGTIKGIAVLKYLGGRVSAPLVNLTALLTSVPASMHGFGNIPLHKTFGHLAKAGKLYGTYKFGNKESLPADIQLLFDEIHNKGWHNAQYNREALAVLRGKAGRGWDKAIDWSMVAFGVTEQLNRVSTIAGAYLGLKAQGQTDHDAMLNLAKKISDQSHATYGKANWPSIARGSHPAAQVMKAFYVFRTFSHNYMLTMKDLWGEGWTPKHGKAFSYMALSPAVLAGAGGVVGWDLIMKAIGMARDLDDPEEDMYNWLEANIGAYAENFARFGGFGLIGMNLKGSLEIGITDLPTTWKDILGAPGSVITDFYYGGENLLKGDISKGLEKIAPLALAAPLKAYREATEGLTTRRNVPIFYGRDRVKADMTDAILRGLSFNPAAIAKIREQKWAERQQERRWKERRSDINSKIMKFMLRPVEDRNKADWADILEDIREYNERIKRMKLVGIIPFIAKKSIRTNIRRSFKPTKRELRRRAKLNE